MPKDTVTIVLNGEVNLSDLAQAVSAFQELMAGISEQVGDPSLRWVVEDSQPGSFAMTNRAVGDAEIAQQAVDYYENVGINIQDGLWGELPPKIQMPARKLVRVVRGGLTSIRFETNDVDVEIYEQPSEDGVIAQISEKPQPILAYGSVRGRIQSLHQRSHLRFTMYDANTDRAVSCYLEEGQENIMREAWGRLAIVEGLIRRDPRTGNPTTIREIGHIEILPEFKQRPWIDILKAGRTKKPRVTTTEALKRVRNG